MYNTIKIYIPNYFMENMFNKKDKINNKKQIFFGIAPTTKIKGNRYCIIIEK